MSAAFGEGFPNLLKCIDSTGNIVGDSSPSTACKNTLPTCSDLLKKTVDTVKSQLVMKLYGFQNNLDLDLEKTTLNEPIGKKLPQPLCSVVGHSIVYKGDRDLEFDEARNSDDLVSTGGKNKYTGESCGSRPHMRKGGGRQNGKKELAIVFLKDQGTRWSSVLLGGRLWTTQKAAYSFFNTTEDKPEKVIAMINEKLISPTLASLAEKAKQTQDQLDYTYSSLPADVRNYCEQPDYADLIQRCNGTGAPLSASDPALRLCQIVGANQVAQGAGIQSAIVAQILADSDQLFSDHFSGMLKEKGTEYRDENNQSPWAVLARECVKRTGNFLHVRRRRRMARQASCTHDGDWVRVSKDWIVYDSDENTKPRRRKAQKRAAFYVGTDVPTVFADDLSRSTNESPYQRNGK
ncbi:hypothetical protein EBZ37_13505, partial [bacterium]|nr:hypothetical protein [bacterium]